MPLCVPSTNFNTPSPVFYGELAAGDLVLNKSGSIWVAVLNRPQVRNALRRETLQVLDGALKEFGRTITGRALIITGEGKAFCAGGDIGEMEGMREEDARVFVALAHRVTRRIMTLEKPIIAAVNGAALGAGFDLATSCDLVVASEDAIFGSPTLRLGIITPFGGLRRLPRMIGLHRAKQLFFTGETLDAAKARELGLVNLVVGRDELLARARALAQSILENAPIALGYAKRLANLSCADNGADLAQVEAELYAKCFRTRDRTEGMRAFREKRKPVFLGQ